MYISFNYISQSKLQIIQVIPNFYNPAGTQSQRERAREPARERGGALETSAFYGNFLSLEKS